MSVFVEDTGELSLSFSKCGKPSKNCPFLTKRTISFERYCSLKTT